MTEGSTNRKLQLPKAGLTPKGVTGGSPTAAQRKWAELATLEIQFRQKIKLPVEPEMGSKERGVLGV